jgi:hypothetical protein
LPETGSDPERRIASNAGIGVNGVCTTRGAPLHARLGRQTNLCAVAQAKGTPEFSQKWRAAPGAPNILPHLPCSLVLLPKQEVFTIFSFPLWA